MSPYLKWKDFLDPKLTENGGGGGCWELENQAEENEVSVY